MADEHHHDREADAQSLRRYVSGFPLRLRVLENTGWILVDRILRLLLGIAVGAWVARHLGPVGYGQLSYILSILILFQSICMLGLDGPVVREISQDRLRVSTILGSARWLSIGAGVIGWIAAALTVVSLRPRDPQALVMMLIAGAALIFQPARIVDLWLQSESRSKISTSGKTLAYLLTAAIKVALILKDAPIWAFAAVSTIETALVALALGWSYRRWPGPGLWVWERECAKELLKESWPFLLAALSIAIYMRIDQIMIRELAGEVELGYYSAVVPISQAWHMFPVALAASVLPRLSQLQRGNRALYELRLQQILIVLAWGGVVAAVLTIVAAPIVVRLLLGSQFLPAVQVLQWHALSNVFVALGVAHNLAMVSERASRTALYKAAFGAAVSISANALLIPRWGALGAAWSSVAAYSSSAMLSNIILAPRIFRMQLRAFMPIYRSPSRSSP